MHLKADPGVGKQVVVNYKLDSGVASSLTLKHPLEAIDFPSFQVTLGESMLTIDQYSIKGNTLILNEAPEAPSQLKASYYPKDRTPRARFPLSRLPESEDSLVVKINDVPTQDYIIDPENQQIFFSPPPPEASVVTVSYQGLIPEETGGMNP